MDDQIYLAFLVGVGKNSVTFATHTIYSGVGDTETRRPSILNRERIDEVLLEMDRGSQVISDWSKMYCWLGRDVGTWATFSKDVAARLVPHWFSDDVEYICRITEDGPTEFVDVNLSNITDDRLRNFHDLAGSVDSNAGKHYTIGVRSNLVLTTKSIFAG